MQEVFVKTSSATPLQLRLSLTAGGMQLAQLGRLWWSEGAFALEEKTSSILLTAACTSNSLLVQPALCTSWEHQELQLRFLKGLYGKLQHARHHSY